MRRAKVDQNQAEIVAALRDFGAAVTSLHRVGEGVPDLLVSFLGVWYLMEIKSGKAKTNDLQNEWIEKQKAPTFIVRSPGDAIRILAQVEEAA